MTQLVYTPEHQRMADDRQCATRDIRMGGFTELSPASKAVEWVDQFGRIAETESISLDAAVGRILAETFLAPTDYPPDNISVRDGYAVRSCETVGAGSYNPLPFCLQSYQPALRPFSAALITSGSALPMGADAVAAFDIAEAEAESVNLIGSVAQGEGVCLKGQEVRSGTAIIESSCALGISDVGLLASFGFKRISVVRRPRVRILLAGCKPASRALRSNANGPMLRAAVHRDGGIVEVCRYGVENQDAIAEWLVRPGADLILVSGRTGTGPDDEAPLALDAAGKVSLHGIAVRPGGSTGMGSVGNVPVILLPGSPLDCLCAYDLFAGRLVRKLGGRTTALPYRTRQATIRRRLVSAVGTIDLCRVLLVGGDALPMGTAEAGGLASLVRADGFVLVPASMEGYAPGTVVDVYMYDEVHEAEGVLK